MARSSVAPASARASIGSSDTKTVRCAIQVMREQVDESSFLCSPDPFASPELYQRDAPRFAKQLMCGLDVSQGRQALHSAAQLHSDLQHCSNLLTSH